MTKKNVGILLLVCLALYCCKMPEDDVSGTVETPALSLNNAEFQNIKNLESEKDIPGLIEKIRTGNEMEKESAIRALWSQPDPGSYRALEETIKSKSNNAADAVRALGQSRDPEVSALVVSAFENLDSLRIATDKNAAVLEAIGKVGDESLLEFLASTRSFQKEDTALILGQIRGLYEYGLRGMVSDSGTAYAVRLVTDTEMPEQVRVSAANYLYRSRDIDLRPHGKRLIPIALNHKNPYVRMALIKSLEKARSADLSFALEKLMSDEKDYRVIVNALRALPALRKSEGMVLAKQALGKGNHHISKTALSYMSNNAVTSDGMYFYKLKSEIVDPELKMMTAGIANKTLSWRNNIEREKLNSELKAAINSDINDYAKVAAVEALGHEIQNFQFLKSLAFNTKVPVIKSSTVGVVQKMIKSEKFQMYYGAQHSKIRRETGAFFIKAIESGDVGMIAMAASALRDPELKYKGGVKVDDKIEKVMEALNLPKEIESYNELKHTLAYLNDTEYEPKEPNNSKGVEWESLVKYSDSTEVIVRTSRGPFSLVFYPYDAPASVANFLYLAETGFYNDKNIHRVVPNFVIQTGCPRGDGYGSLDYAIHTEVARQHYDSEGYLGMASAGRNTECTQWFITHSPTPHLNGKYTIFGKVDEGMDVIHKLQMGDKITAIDVSY